jgi:hypothetical protein
MISIFTSNEAELQKLHAKVRETFRGRNESPSTRDAWQKACATFHSSYDQLAFPGGLAREFTQLDQQDPNAIEMALRFLEANPWYFRSGYLKEELLARFKKLPLTHDQIARLRKVILERIQGRPVREMRAYTRLAPRVTNPEFEAELRRIAEGGNRIAARYAQWAIQCLKSRKAKYLLGS